MNLPTVVVLASGRGERFRASGGQGSKLHARLGSATVLEHTLAAVRASGLSWHLEAGGHPGMGDSIAAGVRATATAQGWLILPGDLPLLRPATLRRVATEAAAAPVLRPAYQGQAGHPVRFDRVCAPALMALHGEAGAAAVLRAHGVQLLEVDDPGCVMDIDTVDDLARAEQWLASLG
ncbi:MAG: nucleotidyltransferase family protein [Acidovorax sp.]